MLENETKGMDWGLSHVGFGFHSIWDEKSLLIAVIRVVATAFYFPANSI